MTETSEVSAHTSLSENSSTVLDIIRVLAAEAVLGGHLLRFLNKYPADGLYPYIQSLAVPVFFLLSGFLTMYSFLNRRSLKREYRLGDYVCSRFARIFGGFLPALLLIAILDGLLILQTEQYQYSSNYNAFSFIANILMIYNYPYFKALPLFSCGPFGSGRPLWTLSIEWWLYMLFGLCAYSTAATRKNPLFWIFAAFSSIIPVFNLVYGNHNGITFAWLVGLFVCKCLFSEECAKLKLSGSCILLAVISLVLAWKRICRIHNVFWKYDVRMDFDPLFSVLLGFALFFILWAAQHKQLNLSSVRKPAKAFASYSFALYLTHYSVLYSLVHRFNPTVSLKVVAIQYFILCNIVAVIFHYCLERTANRFLTKAAFLIRNTSLFMNDIVPERKQENTSKGGLRR